MTEKQTSPDSQITPENLLPKIGFFVVLVLIALTVWGVIVYGGDSTQSQQPQTQPTQPQPSPTTAPTQTQPTSTPTPKPTTIPTPTSTPIPASPTNTNPTPTSPPNPSPTPESQSANPETTEFNLTAKNLTYSLNQITVAPGTPIRINFTNQGPAPHNFNIDALNVHSKDLKPGQSQTLEFTIPTDAADSYTFYCSIDGHREQGMEGTITISG